MFLSLFFFPNLKRFDSTAESWTLHTKHLEQFFLANGIDQVDCKKAIFLTVIERTMCAVLLWSSISCHQRYWIQILEEIITFLNSQKLMEICCIVTSFRCYIFRLNFCVMARMVNNYFWHYKLFLYYLTILKNTNKFWCKWLMKVITVKLEEK